MGRPTLCISHSKSTPAMCLDARAHVVSQIFDVRARRAARVEQEIGVLLADLRPAARQAAAARGID